MTLCVTGHFYTQKSSHFAKSKTICVTFLYKNMDTLRYSIFHWIFEIGGGGGAFLYAKKDALCVTFLYAKND